MNLPILVNICNRITHTIHIQIPTLHDRGNLRRIGIRFQSQLVLTLVNLLRIVAVDAVCGIPMRILLGEAANIGVVISCAEVVRAGFGVEVLAAVAERVLVLRGWACFYAERVVVIRLLSVPQPDHPAGEFYLSAVSQEAFQTSCNPCCFLHSVCGGT